MSLYPKPLIRPQDLAHWEAEACALGLTTAPPYPGSSPPTVVPVTAAAAETPYEPYVWEDEEEWGDARPGFIFPCSLRSRIAEPEWSWRELGRTLACFAGVLLACFALWAVCVGASVMGAGGAR